MQRSFAAFPTRHSSCMLHHPYLPKQPIAPTPLFKETVLVQLKIHCFFCSHLLSSVCNLQKPVCNLQKPRTIHCFF